ncbi:MAG: hypothetical protein WBB25_12590 [Sulfitobacter sp.]
MKMFQTGPDRYAPDPDPKYATIDQRELAMIVGLVALCLPGVLLLASLIGYLVPDSMPHLQTCFRDSISHFYYAQFWGGLFIGALVFIATYLFVYKGEDTHKVEGKLATFAGFAALGVAIFPTSHHGCARSSFTSRAFANFGPVDGSEGTLGIILRPDLIGYFELIPLSQWIHYFCALFLFAFLAWFAFFVFTTVDDHQRNPDGSLKPEKLMRNRLYYFCGGVMVVAILALIAHAVFGSHVEGNRWNALNATFWCEAFALWAFGISWMVKGRFFEKLEDEAEKAPDQDS